MGGLGMWLTVIDAAKAFPQSLEVQFALSRGVQFGPQPLDSHIALVLRLPKLSLHVGNEHRWYGGQRREDNGEPGGLTRRDPVARA